MTAIPKLLFVFSLLLSSVAVGQHAAHVHGEAHLSIAASESALYVEFESPAANLVGFEHAPQSQKEEQALEVVADRLARADELLQFVGTDCRLQEVEVEAPYTATGHAEHIEHDDHTGHGDRVAHASFSANYRFQCDSLSRLDSVYVTLFARFPGIREVRTQWLRPGKQGAAKLTAQHNKLQLK